MNKCPPRYIYVVSYDRLAGRWSTRLYWYRDFTIRLWVRVLISALTMADLKSTSFPFEICVVFFCTQRISIPSCRYLCTSELRDDWERTEHFSVCSFLKPVHNEAGPGQVAANTTLHYVKLYAYSGIPWVRTALKF